jgi:hypothetical protein
MMELAHEQRRLMLPSAVPLIVAAYLLGVVWVVAEKPRLLEIPWVLLLGLLPLPIVIRRARRRARPVPLVPNLIAFGVAVATFVGLYFTPYWVWLHQYAWIGAVLFGIAGWLEQRRRS